MHIVVAEKHLVHSLITNLNYQCAVYNDVRQRARKTILHCIDDKQLSHFGRNINICRYSVTREKQVL